MHKELRYTVRKHAKAARTLFSMLSRKVEAGQKHENFAYTSVIHKGLSTHDTKSAAALIPCKPSDN